MTSIIFGANGQDGYYLRQLLQDRGHRVIGVSRSGDFLRTRISDFSEVSALVMSEKPDYIFHLAADSTTRHEALFEQHETICTGTLNILEAVRQYAPGCKVFISGSGLQFRNTGADIRETDPFEARDYYSVCRISSVYSARYFRSIGIKTYVGYFYNHDSPRRSERHVAQMVAAFAKKVASGYEGILEIGDLSVEKEWTFAGDVAAGMLCLLDQEQVFEANISSGLGYSIRDWVNECFRVIGKDPGHYIRQKEGFASAYKRLVSDASLIRSLGFKPVVSFPQLAGMMMK